MSVWFLAALPCAPCIEKLLFGLAYRCGSHSFFSVKNHAIGVAAVFDSAKCGGATARMTSTGYEPNTP